MSAITDVPPGSYLRIVTDVSWDADARENDPTGKAGGVIVVECAGGHRSEATLRFVAHWTREGRTLAAPMGTLYSLTPEGARALGEALMDWADFAPDEEGDDDGFTVGETAQG